ncbi:MAG: hypothetical protein RIS36_313 [Pseudomonadota bacterium]
MVQMATSPKYFELFERRNPGTVRVSTEHSKDKVIVVRCAVFRPTTAEVRIIHSYTPAISIGPRSTSPEGV